MLRTIIFSSVLVSFLAIISVNATERSATTLSYACAGCHGTAGVSAGKYGIFEVVAVEGEATGSIEIALKFQE